MSENEKPMTKKEKKEKWQSENAKLILEHLQRIELSQKAIRIQFEKGLGTIKYAMDSAERISKEQIKLAEMLINNINEQIILCEVNADRRGRKPLTDDEIEQIRALLRQGYSQRKVAEMTDHGNGTVAKYAEKKKEQPLTTEPKAQARPMQAPPSATEPKAQARPVQAPPSATEQQEQQGSRILDTIGQAMSDIMKPVTTMAKLAEKKNNKVEQVSKPSIDPYDYDPNS